MRVIEYHHSNFKEVLQILSNSRAEFSDNGEPERVIFNVTKNRFEHYDSGEKTSSRTDEYMHVREAIDHYIRSQGNDNNAKTLDEEPVMRIGDDTRVSDDVIEADYTELDTDLPPIVAAAEDTAFPDIDDADLRETTNANIAVITELKDKINEESREKFLQVIANIYNHDIISESDIALAIVETNELKKLLSMLFSKLDIQVSSTKVSSDLKVTSGTLKFLPKIEYSLEDYRRGASQCFATMSALAEAKTQLDDKDRRITDLSRDLVTEKRISAESSTELEKLKSEKTEAKKIQSLIPMEYVIVYQTDKGPRYVYSNKEKFAEDGSIPTKYLGSSSRIEKARRFSLEDAQKQIQRMIRHNNNVSFADLKDKGSKELSKFFSIYATAVVKIENESGE